MISPEDFLQVITSNDKPTAPFKIGTIPAGYTSGRPTVQFDGESAASTRTYPYLSSYTPTANDRVLLAMVGHGAVILGKIV